MDIIVNSVKSVLLGVVVLVINIPIFWSFQGFLDFIKNALKLAGIEI